MNMTRRRAVLAAIAAAAPLPWPARAQDKPIIRILVGLPPGGGTDAIARVFADRLPHVLGQPVIVENRVGAGGRLAADELMRASPDGLTYMIAPNATPTFQTLVFGSQIKWDIWRDFAPVASLVSYPLGMAVSLATGASNAREFIDWVKKNPTATFGTPGLGGQNHFLGVQFAKAAGIDLPVTPYKGTPPLITDLVGGHVPAAVTLMDETMKFHRSGKVRVIGIFSAKRSDLMPDIPTMAEQGIQTPHAEGWTAVWAPARTPAGELERMQAALQKVMALPEVRETLTARLSVEPDFRGASQTADRQRAELATWAPIVKSTGFKPE
ncbi:tripartite tricarboxylate transporter substrate-binding protein [Piscinibacter sp.]|uniref:tripartite tricarboxylate transporter substrate-binding protein n=1 Tax=Piscinibacter sp. TaxID=1903157 RepID=UPI002C7C4320|nr:tripartite tricarboxylate transporter substrate-binding protein [Albitalea sp.]HUG25957.1 tripartite tricarboxylate transporter substrate-binding protein [Albitalea sp.]